MPRGRPKGSKNRPSTDPSRPKPGQPRKATAQLVVRLPHRYIDAIRELAEGDYRSANAQASYMLMVLLDNMVKDNETA